jgi:hypothetical protein
VTGYLRPVRNPWPEGMRVIGRREPPHPFRQRFFGARSGLVSWPTCALAGLPLGAQCCRPGLAGQDSKGVGHGSVGVDPHRILHSELVQVLHKGVHARTAVTADQDPAALLGRQLAERCGEDLDVIGSVIGSVVRRRPSRPQQRREGLAGSAVPVVEERRQRVRPKVRLNVGVAPCFSEWACTMVASRSVITGPSSLTGALSAQTRSPASHARPGALPTQRNCQQPTR